MAEGPAWKWIERETLAIYRVIFHVLFSSRGKRKKAFFVRNCLFPESNRHAILFLCHSLKLSACGSFTRVVTWREEQKLQQSGGNMHVLLCLLTWNSRSAERLVQERSK